MILLDTNAVIWAHLDRPRARPLRRHAGRLRVSPATILELQFLVETGRIRALDETAIGDVTRDARWKLDDAPSTAWFLEAARIGWTRDPFDRLIVGHAELRGWRLATGDENMIERLPADRILAL